jgi:quercetin dioxygenase-like cupin family protein
MKIVKINEVSKVPVASPLFTEPDVTRQVLVPDSKEFNVNIVNFGTGVRNKFHAHDGEQILIVTAGRGIVATRARSTGMVQPRIPSFLTCTCRE